MLADALKQLFQIFQVNNKDNEVIEKRAEDLEQLTRKVAAFINATIHRNEPIDCRFVFDRWIVQARVEHDDGKRQHITRI